MKYIVTVLSALWALIACANSTQMQDPLIGLSFDPGEVRFESAPDLALSTEDKKRGKWYLFAKYEDETHADRSYLVISGLVSTYGDSNPPRVISVEPDFGFIARCDGTNCKVLGVPDRMYSDLGLSNAVVKGLATDAVLRLIAAFGGKDALQASLDAFSLKAKNPSMEGEILRAFEAAGISMKKWKAMK